MQTYSSFYSSICFGSTIRFERPDTFQRTLEASPTYCSLSQTDPLILGDSPYQSPGWKLYERSCKNNQNGARPIACYPWGSNSIGEFTDIYTGAMITGTGGGITDGKGGIRFHLDRQPENLVEMQAPLIRSPLKRVLSNKMMRLDTTKSSALLLGGNISIPAYKQDSQNLFDNLLTLFKDKQIRTSYFWGQDSTEDLLAQTRAFYTANTDTWHILKMTKDPKTQNSFAPPTTIQELCKAFENIHLSSRDKLYLESNEGQYIFISPIVLNSVVFLFQLKQTLKNKIPNLFNINKI